MSAGTGIWHSEMNPRRDADVHFVQMWVLPDTERIRPGYEQLDINAELAKGGLVPVASGRGHDAAISIRQRGAVLWGGRLRAGEAVRVPDAPYVHVFVARGDADARGRRSPGRGRRRPADPRRLPLAHRGARRRRGPDLGDHVKPSPRPAGASVDPGQLGVPRPRIEARRPPHRARRGAPHVRRAPETTDRTVGSSEAASWSPTAASGDRSVSRPASPVPVLAQRRAQPDGRGVAAAPGRRALRG